jgi:hypothetical protein
MSAMGNTHREYGEQKHALNTYHAQACDLCWIVSPASGRLDLYYIQGPTDRHIPAEVAGLGQLQSAFYFEIERR